MRDLEKRNEEFNLMRRILVLASCFVLALGMTSAVKADLVSDFWAKVTSDTVNPGNAAGFGEEIRVVFVTSPIVRGDLVSQVAYDGLALKAAQTGALTGALGDVNTAWKSLVTAESTQTTSPSTNPVLQWVGVAGNAIKVFNTNGDFVGETGELFTHDLWAPIKYNGSGSDLSGAGANTAVWTGTDASGEAAGGSPPLWLGNQFTTDPKNRRGMTGDFTQTDGKWVENEFAPFEITQSLAFVLPIYSMSGTISAVPEPSTILLWLGFSSIAGMMYWRKRRS